MIKYSTPSIEVVSFSPSDAPRIGMQWFVKVADAQWETISNTYTGPTNIVWTNPAADLTDQGVSCSSVAVYCCTDEVYPESYVADDGKSC